MEQAIEVEGCLIFQSGCHGSFIGRLDLDLQDGELVGWKHALIAVDESVPPDPAFEAAVTDALTGEREAMAEVVGRTDVALHRYAMLSSPMDDLLLEAIAEVAGTQIAFSKGWSYGAPAPAGPLNPDDVLNQVSTKPPASTTEGTG